MEIYNDYALLETDENTTAPINLALSSITDIATGKIPFSKTIKIPDTPGNRRKLGYSSEVFSLTRFNNARHQARIEQDGFVVMQGVAQLSKVETTPTGRYFHMNMIGNEIEWITKASETPLSETDLGLPDAVITDSLPRGSLSPEHTTPYRLFPVQKGKFIEEAGDDKWQDRTQTILSDYAPFFHLPTLFRAIFRQAGYTVSSSFLESGAVADLYVSGQWKRFDTDDLDEKYGFKAGRFAGKELVQEDNFGISAEMIGNLVDTADPDAESEDGDKAGDVHNNGGGFQMIDGKPYYVVPEDATIGFRVTIPYSTNVNLVNMDLDNPINGRNFFNELWFKDFFGEGEKTFNVESLAPSLNKDTRNVITPDTQYLFSTKYAIEYTKTHYLGVGWNDDNKEPDEWFKLSDYPDRKILFTTRSTTQGKARIYEYIEYYQPEKKWRDISGLYGWEIIELPVEYDITAAFTTSVQKRLKGERIPISTPGFYGFGHILGSPITPRLSLSKDTTVETYFAPQVGAGDPVNTENMLAYDDVKQLDLIKAVKQLFNLYLYTDAPGRTVYIEPLEQFYNGPVLDWTGKVDYSKTIEMEEIGGDLGRNFVLAYKDGDPQVSALNESTKSKYAQYSTPILNTVGKQEDYTVANEVFTPSIIKAGGYPAAKDAGLLQIGDPKDTDEESPYERDMSFEPKVVRYGGLQALPTGQQWLYPSGAESVAPAISFQDEATNLGFDKENGLNRYYRENAILYNHGRRLTLYLNLTARDVEPFVILNEEKRDFRATIKIRMAGEDVLCKLEEIKDFDPGGKGPTKCVLITG